MQHGSDLTNRQLTGGGAAVIEHVAPTSRAPAPTGPDVVALAAAIRALRPTKDVHCGHCWGAGREAALRVLEGGA